MFFSPCSYFGSVNFTEGRCPGSKAMNFSNVGSFATVPNVNITVCNFTVACWIRSFQPISDWDDFRYNTIIMGSSMNGKLILIEFHSSGIHFLGIKRELSVNEMSFTIDFLSPTEVNGWNHIAVTCEKENTVKVFINGKERKAGTHLVPLDDNFQSIISGNVRPPKRMYRIGNYLLDDRFVNQFFGSVMDLLIVGFALPQDQIFDLYKG